MMPPLPDIASTGVMTMVSEMVFRWWINKLHRDDHVAVYEEPLNYGTELAPICVLPNGREKWNQHFRELFGI